MKTIRENGLLGVVPEDAQAALVMLHGYGDSAQGLLDLAPVFAEKIPGLAVFSLDAPEQNEQPEMAAFGGRQWFSLADYFARGFKPGDFSGAIATLFPYIKNKILHAAKLAAVPAEQVFVLGFSQGAMVALSYALTSGEKTAGVIACAGIGDFSASAIVVKPPVFSIHGTADEVVPFVAQEELQRTLAVASVPAEFLAIPGAGHDGIFADAVMDEITTFLRKILNQWPIF